ncbi:RAD50-interacting protein, partial [Lachnellula suecica]
MPSPSITRDKSPLAVLLNPEDNIPRTENDIKLEDYLNDKIQTNTDFSTLANLIASVDLQKEQLEKQLQDAKSKLEQAKQSSANRASSMLEQSQEFERQRDDVQRRLMLVTNSYTPEEAALRLQGPIKKLQRVELARSYVELVKDVDDLVKEARRNLPQDPKEALKPYIQLKALASSLTELQGPAEGAAPHLVLHVHTTTERLWTDMKKIMMDEFESILQRSNWPEVADPPTREWSDCFEKLLDLQAPEILAAREPLALLPMEVLSKHFIQQFRFHFSGNMPTNQTKDLGYHFFNWFTGTIDHWEDYMRNNVTPILAAHFRGHRLAGNSLYLDSVAAFITALLPVLKEKVDSLVQEISTEPQYLSKFIHNLILFDESIRSKYKYDGGNSKYGWKGLSWGVLDTWFDRWSEVEKKFALERYQEIVKAEDSGLIDYESISLGKTKTTYGATKVTDLIESVTQQYNMLRRFSHKFRFLVDIQADILDHYRGRLHDSLERYMSITTAVGRTIHGVSKEERAKLEGIGGLESLCKVYCSADHIISMLKECVNEEFFVGLWNQLQGRAKVTSSTDVLVGSMSYSEVKDVTSTAMGSDGEGSVFDVTINNYTRLTKKTEKLIIQAIQHAFPTSFRAYFNKPEWTTVGDVRTVATTAELDQPLETMRDNLDFLSRTLSQSANRRIWRACLGSVEDLLYQNVLLKQKFTTLGAARLQSDIDAIQRVVISTLHSTRTMPKLQEGVMLLNLPIETSFDVHHVTLQKAAKEVFESNAQAEDILASLDFKKITVPDAKRILQNRIEAMN